MGVRLLVALAAPGPPCLPEESLGVGGMVDGGGEGLEEGLGGGCWREDHPEEELPRAGSSLDRGGRVLEEEEEGVGRPALLNVAVDCIWVARNSSEGVRSLGDQSTELEVHFLLASGNCAPGNCLTVLP